MTAIDHGPVHAREDPLAAIDRLAGELKGIASREVADSLEYTFDGAAFAVREGRTHSFLLGPEIATAGLRTPGTARTPRGAGWISLRSDPADGFTVDRARAWFELAWRLAGGEPPKPPLEDDGKDDPEN
jgi:hypothetical protein